MSDFNPTEAERLAAEFAEDDERATPGNWHAADCISPQIALYAVPKDKAELRAVGEGDLLYLGRVYADGKGQGRRNMSAITRMRSNARAAAEQLRAACAEVERLRHLSRDIHSIAWAGGRHEAKEEETARLASVENLCEEAADALSSLRHGRWEIGYVHERVDRITAAIRAALAKKETL